MSQQYLLGCSHLPSGTDHPQLSDLQNEAILVFMNLHFPNLLYRTLRTVVKRLQNQHGMHIYRHFIVVVLSSEDSVCFPDWKQKEIGRFRDKEKEREREREGECLPKQA